MHVWGARREKVKLTYHLVSVKGEQVLKIGREFFFVTGAMLWDVVAQNPVKCSVAGPARRVGPLFDRT